MSKCDLKIVLDEPGRTYQPGDRVTGVIEVVVDKECRCDGLTLTRRWRTHGRGNRDEGGEKVESLFEGTWQPGDAFSYGFEFEAPAGPVTYHGEYLNVDWYVEARADIPWALDPKAKTEFLLQSDGEREVSLGPKFEAATEWLKTRRKRLAGVTLIGGLMFLAGVIVLAIALLVLKRPFLSLFIGGGLVIGGIAVSAKPVWNALAKKKLGNVDVRLDRGDVRPGETISSAIRITPRKDVEVEEVVFALVAKEEVISGSGTNRTTHRKEVHRSEERVTSISFLRAGTPAEETVEVRVPEDAPSTFMAPENRLLWSVDVRVGIPRWPDWRRSYPVTVRPGSP